MRGESFSSYERRAWAGDAREVAAAWQGQELSVAFCHGALASRNTGRAFCQSQLRSSQAECEGLPRIDRRSLLTRPETILPYAYEANLGGKTKGRPSADPGCRAVTLCEQAWLCDRREKRRPDPALGWLARLGEYDEQREGPERHGSMLTGQAPGAQLRAIPNTLLHCTGRSPGPQEGLWGKLPCLEELYHGSGLLSDLIGRW